MADKKTSPENLEPFLYEYGYSCYQAGQFHKAIDMFRTCSVINGTRARNWLALGSALMMAGKEKEAIEPLIMAGHLNPEDVRPQLYRAQCLLAQKKFSEVETLLNEMEKNFPVHKKSIDLLRLQIQ